MTSRYDTTGNVETQFEPGSGDRVLANKLGVPDPREINNTEWKVLDRPHKDVINYEQGGFSLCRISARAEGLCDDERTTQASVTQGGEDRRCLIVS